MGLTNAAKQAAHRARKRARGLVHVQAWATPDQARAIRAILSGTALTVPMPIIKQSKRKKALSSGDTEQLHITDANRHLVEKYKSEIQQMEADRVSRSHICHWLEARGADFGGNTMRLNAMLGPRVFT